MALLRVAAAAALVALVVMLGCFHWGASFTPPSNGIDMTTGEPLPYEPPWPAAHPVESGLIAGGIVLVIGATVVAV